MSRTPIWENSHVKFQQPRIKILTSSAEGLMSMFLQLPLSHPWPRHPTPGGECIGPLWGKCVTETSEMHISRVLNRQRSRTPPSIPCTAHTHTTQTGVCVFCYFMCHTPIGGPLARAHKTPHQKKGKQEQLRDDDRQHTAQGKRTEVQFLHDKRETQLILHSSLLFIHQHSLGV